MKLQVTFETGSPSRLDGLDGAIAIVYQDDRPLRGVAVRADWRLNGFLSRLVAEERFLGDPDEWLLVHTQARLPYTHLFLVGMGRRGDHSEARARRAIEAVAGKVALAGLHAFAIDLGELVGDTMALDDAMFLFLERLSSAYPDDELSNPPYRPALDVQQRNDERLQAFRDRRQQLVQARDAWAASQEASGEAPAESGGDAGDGDDEDFDEETVVENAGDLVDVPDEDSFRDDASLGEVERSARPVAGGLADESDEDEENRAAEAPPDPATLEEPDLEPAPERTVRVVLIGDTDALGAMRGALRDSGRDGSAPLQVEWSR